jgi:hypothetical protein
MANSAQTPEAPANAVSGLNPSGFPEMPFSANVRALDPYGFEWQFTTRAVTASGFSNRVEMMQKFLTDNNFIPTGASPHTAFATPSHAADEAEPEGEPDRPDWCPIHHVTMKSRTRDGQTWYSHKVGDEWCRGKNGKRG